MVLQPGDVAGVERKIHTFGGYIAQENAQLQDRCIHSLVQRSFPWHYPYGALFLSISLESYSLEFLVIFSSIIYMRDLR